PPVTSYIYTLSLHDALPIFTKGEVCITTVTVSSYYDRLSSHQAQLDIYIWTFTLGLFIMDGFIEFIYTTIGFFIIFFLIPYIWRSEEHTSELQSRFDLVCRL